ncbi:hypothetical protein D9619_004402 [Psilocybe cf. subviscida]|uniref:Galactose oxidase n=1 Tax=Psilocybe cf. subviscida TaxID=2480587 RepID=A0A8H5BQT4_9AGAR|nr:hypothetical protein D9619_004402 [Psilocybe cf. subviscida]
MSMHGLSLLLLLGLLRSVHAVDVAARWGQATTVINDALFVYGGKTDQYNAFSYTSAPNVNDILYLSLSDPFSVSSPPWQLVSGSANTTSSQGPALAWSTTSAFNTSEILLFGGQPDANSDIVIVDSNDSAVLIDVFSRTEPHFITQLSGWAREPTRRIRHSASTNLSGLVFVIGGEKADGSQIGFSDHFYFDPNTPAFSPLPTSNAPPDIFGHASIILDDGRIFVFGGFSPSSGSLVPLSTIWVLDTKTLTWSVVQITGTTFPASRMSFASVLIAGGKILIHGGCDANFQVNLSDGWILDPNTMTWTEVDALSQLGSRRDHFAVSTGNEVIFGFGFGNNGPASPDMQIYDTSSGSFVPTFTPPPVTSMTQTLPAPSQTATRSPTSTAGNSPSGTKSAVHPTSTIGNGDPDTPTGDENDCPSCKKKVAVALGTSFSVVAFVVISAAGIYYVRKRRAVRDERRFMALNADDDDDDGSDSPHAQGHIPALTLHDTADSPGSRGLLGTLGMAAVASKFGSVRQQQRQKDRQASQYQRRDMLADEDTRSLGEWYSAQRRDGTGGSSWSLKSIFGAGPGFLRSREPSATSMRTMGGARTPWREKSDPFGDGASLGRDEEIGLVGGAGSGRRPHSRREASYATYASSKSGASYRDPFVDPIYEEKREEFQPMDLYTDRSIATAANTDVKDEHASATARPTPPVTPIRTSALLPLSQQTGHALSPLTERTSQSTLGVHAVSSGGSSNDHSTEQMAAGSPWMSRSQATSMTSFSYLPSLASPTSQPTSSLLNPANPAHPPSPSNDYFGAAGPPMRRSDSWWNRFSRTSFLDRRSGDGGANPRGRYDIRDPTPAPRLGAIEEGSIRSADKSRSGSGNSGNQEKQKRGSANSNGSVGPQRSLSLGSNKAPAKAKVYQDARHGRSATSVQTADTDLIEKMAASMDVVQHLRATGSTSSAGGRSVESQASVAASEMGHVVPAPQPSTAQRIDDSVALVASPEAVEDASAMPLRMESIQQGLRGAGSPTKVSERVKELERAQTQSPRQDKERERPKKVGYGLAPRASLFVANPDNRGSDDS